MRSLSNFFAVTVLVFASSAAHSQGWTVNESKEVADYEAYIERYPYGSFAALAMARIDSLTIACPPANPDEVKLELSYWESVKNTADPLLMRAYLEKYPAGHIKEMAEAMLESSNQRVGIRVHGRLIQE